MKANKNRYGSLVILFYVINIIYTHTSRVFLLHQLWIVNYCVKSQLNNLSNENLNNGVSVVFMTKCESKCQNELFLKYHFSENTSLYVFINQIICQTFDIMIDNPQLMLQKDSATYYGLKATLFIRCTFLITLKQHAQSMHKNYSCEILGPLIHVVTFT